MRRFKRYSSERRLACLRLNGAATVGVYVPESLPVPPSELACSVTSRASGDSLLSLEKNSV